MSTRALFNQTKFTEKYFVSLFILTLALITWQHYGMGITMTIPASAITNSQTLNDSVNGGASIGRVSFNSSAASLTCQTQRSITFAFCSLLIPLGDNANPGVDLTRYQSITFDLLYREEKNQHDTVLIYLLNQEGAGDHADKRQRANVATITPIHNKLTRYTIPLAQFAVPSWWAYAHPNVVDHSRNLDNTLYVQIATGDSHKIKNVRFEISHIRFDGKWIYAPSLYRLLLVIWLFSALIIFAFRYRTLMETISRKHRDIGKMHRKVSELKQEKHTFAELSKRDHLTQVLNRKGFEEYYQHSHSKSKRSTLILFDVDNFKTINDNFGHQEGDQILQKIAQVAASQLRGQDALARWGGEEFLILCLEADLHIATTIAERVRRAIQEQITTSNQAPVTCTFGVATLTTSLEESLINADKALYRGKQTSKNSVNQHI